MKKKALIIAGVVLAAIAWFAFRPERLIVNQKVNESLQPVQAASAKTIATGSFHGVAHDGMGTATIHQLADSRRVLRFTNFSTSNGPELQVYLVAADDATDSDTVRKAGFQTLGALKGNIGDQNYDIGNDIDLSKYHAVTVWCRRFGVNFATAPLKPNS
ncbi:MAG TPA: DM13 domain-containing protein [Tepidisphaeraceae bacterium]|nr:DM13 domain-containing protein [Tepidisphaeraceae bacterium]